MNKQEHKDTVHALFLAINWNETVIDAHTIKYYKKRSCDRKYTEGDSGHIKTLKGQIRRWVKLMKKLQTESEAGDV